MHKAWLWAKNPMFKARTKLKEKKDAERNEVKITVESAETKKRRICRIEQALPMEVKRMLKKDGVVWYK